MSAQTTDAVNTPVELTPDEVVKRAAEYKQHLISNIVPQVIVERLVNKHGHVFKSAAEANRAVAAAVDLFQMHQNGLVDLSDPETAEEESPLIKAANEVLKLSNEIRNQYDSGAVTNHFLSNPELMEKAVALVSQA